MTYRLLRVVFAFALVMGFLAVAPRVTSAQFVNYDKFSAGFIDPELWEAVTTEGTFNAPTTEVIRAVEQGRLHLGLVSWGNSTSDSGSTTSRTGLQFRQLGTLGGTGSIVAMKAKVTVLDALVQDCPANPDTGGAIRARAQVIGWFFNDGTSSGATDDTGNVLAGIQLAREADGSNQIQPFVQRCTTANCSSVITPPGVVVPGFTKTWAPNVPLVVKILWDRAAGKFTFKVTDPATAATETHSVVYQGIVTDAAAPANGDFKMLRLQNSVKNCSTGRKQVLMHALFDAIGVQRQP